MRQLVTLDQIAAIVRRSRKTLQNYRCPYHPRAMPEPAVEGSGKIPHLYDWARIRCWLSLTFAIPLPEHFPYQCIEVPDSAIP